MVKIENFDQGIRYVIGLGFTVKPGFPGWIISAGKRFCNTEQALWLAGGGKYPYQAHYHRKERRFTVLDLETEESVSVDAKRF